MNLEAAIKLLLEEYIENLDIDIEYEDDEEEVSLLQAKIVKVRSLMDVLGVEVNINANV